MIPTFEEVYAALSEQYDKAEDGRPTNPVIKVITLNHCTERIMNGEAVAFQSIGDVINVIFTKSIDLTS